MARGAPSGRSVAFTSFEVGEDAVATLLGAPEVREFVEQKVNEVRDKILLSAPKVTGNYLSGIHASVVPNAKGRPIGRVLVKAPHAHLVEFGTVERFRKDGSSTGVMPPQHIIGRAVRAAGLKLGASYRDGGRPVPEA